MFNPLKMSSGEKQMLIGGIATSLIYWGNYMAEEQAGYPAELKARIDPHLPRNGDLLAGIAPPLALYTIVKYGKKGRLRNIADGSILFGVPNIIARTVSDAAYAEGQAAKPAVRFTAPMASKYVASASAPLARNMTSGLSKYTITS